MAMAAVASNDPAVVVSAVEGDAGLDRDSWLAWWSSGPVMERDRPAVDVLAETRDED